jgi:tellurite methyltransferase
MLKDKTRWNEKYKELALPTYVTKEVEKYHAFAIGKEALDIACGKGRNSNYLLEQGFNVDAIDYSDEALKSVDDRANKIDADLDDFTFEQNRYHLILNINFLNRNKIPQIKEALKKSGIIIFRTMLEADKEGFRVPSNRDYLLRKNELLHLFIDHDIIYYEEYEDLSLQNEKVMVASLVARKR